MIVAIVNSEYKLKIKKKRRKIEIIGFLISWFAIIKQFVLIIENRQANIPETIVRFFSFFTILTNILVACFFTSKVFHFSTNKISLFNKKGALTAITTFILIVGLVYQVILRSIWEPKGMQLIVDELLHSIIPVFTLIYWIMFSTKEKINFSDVTIWLLYPLLYLIFVLVRGAFSMYYPYPFLNISEFGIGKVLLNSFIILLLLLFIMGILVFIKNKLSKTTFNN